MSIHSKRRVVMLPLAVVVGALLLSGCSSNQAKVKTATVQTGTVEETVYASGYVEPNEQFMLYGPTGMNAEKVMVDVGDNVTKGETLVSFDDSDLQTQLSAAKNQLQVLQIQLQSYKNLKNSGGAALQQSGGVSLDDQIKMQEIQIDNQKLNITSLENKLKDYTIKSPANGIVASVGVTEGAPSPMGQPAVVVYDVSKRNVSLSLNPVDAISVKVGYNATIFFGDQTFSGSVSFVSPVSLNNTVSVKVTIDDGTNIPIGSSVDVEILKDKKIGLVIPSSALIYGEDGSYSVKVVQNNVVQEKTVEVGSQSSGTALITSGLESGEHVIIDQLDTPVGQKVIVE
ncbi:efflux RND transporter periplasmic adaptor subunit [Coprothermobacter platensis]|uniref:efflux RND transporter periplasmic adaptor subunit n=1 Tax=Coprothermobacter platensis TaxID=108819 RepID=UPI000373CAAB|nr:efflux RND transporter periplasmic adaptor subunit [Coprothermobacter platensis]